MNEAVTKIEGDRLHRVIVCIPNKEYYRIRNSKEYNICEVANEEKALKQHHHLKALLRNLGSDAIDVPELKSHPNSLFTQDACIWIDRYDRKKRIVSAYC